MKLAHIIPPKVVGQVSDLLGDYHLLLPALMDQREYRAFYRDAPGFKIMDNGVAEGLPMAFPHVLSMANFMKANEVVLPDVMGDLDGTLRAVAHAFHGACAERKRFRYMFVLQGTTVGECIESARIAIIQFRPIINTFGIPRHIQSTEPNARYRIARALVDSGYSQPIHLLGTHPDDPYELQALGGEYKSLGIRGVDTSMAWNAARSIELLDPKSLSYNYKISRQPIGEFATATASFDGREKLLRQNMENMNSWIN